MRDVLRKLWAPIAALGFLLWKLKFLFVALFKFKLFTVAGSMLVSIGAYALLWGWQFAVGFVLLLLVHELGHVLEAKRQGLPVSAPMFIPFLGALITLKQLPDDAWAEAKVAIAGPILGGLGAAAVWVARRVDRLRPPRRARPSPASSSTSSTSRRSARSTAAGSSPRSIRRSGSSGSCVLARARDRRAEPDPDPDPRPRRARVVAALADAAQPGGGGVLPRQPAQRRIIVGVSYIVLAALLTLGMSASFVERDI